MEFQTGGVVYHCPLYAFQPRTEVLEPVGEDTAELMADLRASRH
jgi:hypothetical protein